MLSGWASVVSRKLRTSVLVFCSPLDGTVNLLERRRLGEMPRWGGEFPDATHSPLRRKHLCRPPSSAQTREGREVKYGSHYPQCPPTGHCRFVHRRGRASSSRNPEAEPEEAGLAAAAAMMAGQLPSPDCRGSPA